MGRERMGFADTVEIEINQQRFAIPSDYSVGTQQRRVATACLAWRCLAHYVTDDRSVRQLPTLQLPGPQHINVVLRKPPSNGYKALKSAIRRGRLGADYEAGGHLAYVRT